MAYLQAALLSDDLPVDAQLVGLSLEDGLSRLFTATVDFTSEDADIDLVGLLGKPMAVHVDGAADGPPLIVHGQIEEAEYVDARQQVHHYRLRLAPLVQALAHRVRSRIFQDETAVDVVRAVLKDAGIPADALAWDLADESRYPKREFCVQYRESELAFVLRLLEDEGIFFWFEQTDSAHVMHFADDANDLPPIEGEEPALPAAAELHADIEAVTDLVLARRATTDAYQARDWDFMHPNRPAESGAEIAPEPALEVYEYPGGFQVPADGTRRARLRAQELGLPGRALRGTSNSLRLRAGRKLTVTDAPLPPLDGEVLLTAVRQHLRLPFFGAEGDNATSFDAAFEAVPAALPFRPARCTPRPRIWGVESAVVTGPPGEEIHVDEFGRVKVHFYWDREGKIDDKASCWMRVQQQNTSGSMLLPRVGWELSIGFLDGDPDRPVALQKMYNRETMPPYMMPDNKTQSALQSSTSPGGGATNEIRLQDGAGGMEFFVHSSKDFSLNAGHDLSEDITVDAHEEVGLTLKTTVGADETVKVGAAHSVSVTGNAIDQTGGSKSVAVGGLDDWGVTGNFARETGGDRTESIGGLMNVLANQVVETYNAGYQRTVGAVLSMNTASALVETVSGSKTETVGGAKMELIAKSKAETVGGSKMFTSGAMVEKTGGDIGVAAKTAMAFTVGGPIVEKCGGDWALTAKAVGVTVGSATIKGGGSTLKMSGGKVSVKASSLGAAGGPTLKLKGRINFKG